VADGRLKDNVCIPLGSPATVLGLRAGKIEIGCPGGYAALMELRVPDRLVLVPPGFTEPGQPTPLTKAGWEAIAQGYRPDIDGLRAVAVAAVIVFHAFPSLAPGGFVGVDVFFVISGYLISGLIFGQLKRGRFSIREFYYRRIKRIFPASIAF